jgi:hypothetical protein
MKIISLFMPGVMIGAICTVIGAWQLNNFNNQQTSRCDQNIYIVVTTHHWFGDTQQCVSRTAIQGPSLFQTPTKD